MRFYLYNLKPSESHFPVQDLTLLEVSKIANSNPDFIKEVGPITSEDLRRLDVTPQKNPLRWEKVMASLITVLTGKIPFREDIKVGRQIFERLDKDTRRSLSMEEVFSFFPYLLAGFKFREPSSIKGTNNLSYAVSFTERCFSGERLNISSYLCAHKERRDTNPDGLRSEIKEDYALRAINLLRGLARSSRSGGGDIELYQFDGNRYGLVSLFPQIFLKHYREGKLEELMATMSRHHKQLSQLAEKVSDNYVSLKVLDAHETNKEAEELCRTLFGKEWYFLSPEDVQDKNLQSLAIETEGIMKRLMRFGEAETNNRNGNNKQIRDSIELFEKGSRASIFGKAMSEVLFRYMWGKKTKECNGVAVGLDVDEDSYQTEAFSAGYSKGTENFSPILYARRRDDLDLPAVKGLNSLSIRQFWR